MLHSVKDINGKTICICGDKFFNAIMSIPEDKIDEFCKNTKDSTESFEVGGHIITFYNNKK